MDIFRDTANWAIVPLNSEWLVTNLTIGTSAVRLIANPMAQRRVIVIQNIDDPTTGNSIFVGFSEDDSSDLDDPLCGAPDLSEGDEIEPGESATYSIGPGITLNVAADGASTPVQVLEAA